MPTKVLWAYSRLMNSVQVVNCLSTGAGKMYQKPCSIPQGCPLSMTILALMTYPWIQLVKQWRCVKPRALADDLCLWSCQQDTDDDDEAEYLHQWVQAVQATLDYLRNMGAAPAHGKSLLLASDTRRRKQLRDITWQPDMSRIPVTKHTRDLGAHLNTTASRITGTSKPRFVNALQDAGRIGRLPRTLVAKDRMLGAKALAKALYGTEVTEPRIQDVRAFSSACASARTGK